MNNNMLRAPLIKSAIVLAVFSLLVYLTITSGDGSVWSSLQAIFLGVFRAAQLGVGLILALFLCITVLIGIFLGSVAMVSRDSAARMFNQLRDMVSAQLKFVQSLLRIDRYRDTPLSSDSLTPELEKKIRTLMNGALDSLRSEQSALAARVQELLTRVEEGERREEFDQLVARVGSHEERTEDLRETVDQVGQRLRALRETTDQLVQDLQQREADATLSELTGRVEKLERIHDGESHGAEYSLEDEDGLRLFSYLEDPKAQAEIEQLVIEALQQEMSYAQAVEYLLANTEAGTAEVLRAHPALTRDYIRFLRRKG